MFKPRHSSIRVIKGTIGNSLLILISKDPSKPADLVIRKFLKSTSIPSRKWVFLRYSTSMFSKLLWSGALILFMALSFWTSPKKTLLVVTSSMTALPLWIRALALTNNELTTCFHEFFKYKSTIFFTNISQLKKKTNFLWVEKGFFFSFEHLKKSKILCNVWWEKNGRVVFEKFVKTCREPDHN